MVDFYSAKQFLVFRNIENNDYIFEHNDFVIITLKLSLSSSQQHNVVTNNSPNVFYGAFDMICFGFGSGYLNEHDIKNAIRVF